MKTLYRSLALVALIAACAMGAQAQNSVAVTMHSEYYDLYGPDAEFNIMLGSTVSGNIQVDCGFGPVTYKVDPATFSDGTVRGTVIPCRTNAAGVVTIYAPEGLYFDYLNFSGCGLTTLDIAHQEYIDVLDIEHNSLSQLDLTAAVNASALYLGDNPFARSTPLKLGAKPNLAILDMSVIDYVDPSFSLTDYPALVTFDAMSSPWLTECDPSQCPGLMKISIDASNVTSLDVSNNPLLTILNISDTGISEIDLSNNPALTQLYCDHSSVTYNNNVKISHLDLSHNPELKYLFCSYNNLTDIDLSHNTKLQDLYIRNNYLTEIDLSNNPALLNVMISRNFFNFNTLPQYNEHWSEYDYRQRPIQVAKSQLKGEPIDLRAETYRSDSPTTATLYRITDMDEYGTEVDRSLYTYADGMLTINTAMSDSVYCAFFNPMFPDADLRTRPFMVKTAAAYGKPYIAAEINAPMLTSTSTVTMYVGIDDATEAAPKTFYIDFGDGAKRPFTATSAKTPAEPNVNVEKGCYGAIKIYVEETDNLTALEIDDEYLTDIDLKPSRQLAELTLRNTELYSLDLKYNHRLERLVLNGNHLPNVNLDGANGALNKNVLSYIDLSNNEIEDIKLSPVDAIKYLDLSHNSLKSVNLTDGDNIRTLNLSYNDIDYLKINYLTSLRDLDISHNRIDQVIMPETSVLENFVLTHNRFTLTNMPDRGDLDEDHFIYAPQQPLPIPSMAPNCDLSAQCVTIDGHQTGYAWFTTSGEALVEGEDYSITNGITNFSAAALHKSVYCAITNGAYPAFAGDNALRTTDMEVIGLPEYVVGEFTTMGTANNAVLSIASLTENDALYIDWGDGQMMQYPMTTSYTAYTVAVKPLKRVKIYSYTPESNLAVFSVSNMQMKDVDLRKMTRLSCLSLNGAGISDLQMPQSDALTELSLSGNRFEAFDFASYPSVRYLDFDGNLFTEVSLEGMPDLENVSFSNNKLTSIKFADNCPLWSLFLAGNKFAEIDLSGLKSLYQVMLSHNELSSIDLEDLNDLRVVIVDHNRMNFATLPLPREQWTVYYYHNQQPVAATVVDGVVDLGSQASVAGTATVYTWYNGFPAFDEDMGGYVGDVLTEGVDYTIEGGVTTFLRDCPQAVCLMTNEVFPNAIMYTEPLSITGGIAGVTADGGMTVEVIGGKAYVTTLPGARVEVYTATGAAVCIGTADPTGHCTINLPSRGLYIIASATGTAKIAAPPAPMWGSF